MASPKTGKMLRGVSLFSAAGIAETYMRDAGIDIAVANELLPERARLYENLYPDSKMIVGDILDKKIFKEILNSSGKKVDFLIASPPCQGMSIAGKNRNLGSMLKDDRNFLIFRIIDFIRAKKPKFVLIENVPNFLRLELPFHGKLVNIVDILSSLFGDEYRVEADVLNASNFGVPQRRNRAIIKMYKKGLKWSWPTNEPKVTVKDTIKACPV